MTEDNSKPKRSIRKIEAALRQRRAIKMRHAGRSYEAIAKKLGYANKSCAYKAVMTALEKITKEPAKEFKKLEMARLDRLWLAHWPKALDGDVKATEKCLDISERRCKLEGAYAPVRHKIGGDDEAPPIKTETVLKVQAAELQTDELRVLLDLRRRLAGTASESSN